MAHVKYRVSGKDGSKPVSRRFPDTAEGRTAARSFAETLRDAKVVYDVRARVGDREVSKTFARRKDADAFAATMEADSLRGVAVDPRAGRLTVSELAREWLGGNPAKRPDTWATDDYHLRVHILPVLGARRIDAITPTHVQDVANQLATHLAPRTVRRALGVVRAMFAHAVVTDMVGRSPYRGIKLPRVDPTRRRMPTTAQLVALIAAIPERYQPMIYCSVVLGLRFSEVAALRVGQVDTHKHMLSVAETLTRDAQGRPVFGPPKSAASRRTVAMPTPLSDLLAEHLDKRGLSRADPDALIFTAPDGGPIRYANWRNRVWVPACRAAGFPGLGFHDLRRTNATALVALGVNVKTAQERLGHSDVRMTIGLYAQVEQQADRAAADQLGDLFMPKPPTPPESADAQPPADPEPGPDM
jgi:integrase